MSRTGAECVSAPTEIRLAPASTYAPSVSTDTLPDTSTGNRPSTIFTHSATCSGVMLSSNTRSAPASMAVLTWSRWSHSTCTLSPGQRSRARATACGIDRPARWLSLMSTLSERLPRWLTPPPARTAAFSRARRPGVVFRVSRTRALPCVART